MYVYIHIVTEVFIYWYYCIIILSQWCSFLHIFFTSKFVIFMPILKYSFTILKKARFYRALFHNIIIIHWFKCE